MTRILVGMVLGVIVGLLLFDSLMAYRDEEAL